MKKTVLFILPFVVLIFILQGCLKDKGIVPKPPETHCDSLNVSYNLDVKPIVTTQCATSGCHDGNGGAPGNFTNYEHLNGIRTTIAIRLQLPSTDALHMPYGGVLPPEQLDILLCWIDKGAPNN